MPQGKSLDMNETGPISRSDTKLIGSNDYDAIEGSEIVIITAGLARKPGMSREDLQKKNAEIIKSVTENVAKHAPESIIIMVTNPIDVMTYYAMKISGFPKNRIIGQAGILDTARFRFFIAEKLNVSIEDISTVVLGGHGDSMVPLPRYTCISGIPLSEFMDKETIDKLIQRTRKGGGEIVGLLKTGSAYYAPAAASIEMAEAILKDKKRVLPCSAYLSGQYGINDIYIGVPVILGADGVEKIIELKLDDDELKALQNSAAIYRKQIDILEST
jgi:malate dehydrogenase